jgi:hypothetical protein
MPAPGNTSEPRCCRPMADLATSNLLFPESGIASWLVPILILGLFVGIGYAIGVAGRSHSSEQKGK